jgi:hypothetical protein
MTEEYSHKKIEVAVLALFFFNLRTSGSAWKSFPWVATDALYQRGLITDPARKKHSVELTAEGMLVAEDAFRRLFDVNGSLSPKIRPD